MHWIMSGIEKMGKTPPSAWPRAAQDIGAMDDVPEPPAEPETAEARRRREEGARRGGQRHRRVAGACRGRDGRTAAPAAGRSRGARTASRH